MSLINTNVVFDCRIIEFGKHHSDRKDNLLVAENEKNLKSIKVVYLGSS